MNVRNYIYLLKLRLDKLNDEEEILLQLKKAVKELHNNGYSDSEIQKFFEQELIMEAQDSTKTIENHQQYKEMVAKILGEKKQ